MKNVKNLANDSSIIPILPFGEGGVKSCICLNSKVINIVPISFKELTKYLKEGAETCNYSVPKCTS